MDSTHGQKPSDLFQTQFHIHRHLFSFIDSMSLKCAVQLGIPDIIHKQNQPITLSELVSALQILPEKTHCLNQLMRLLVHSGFFATKKIRENEEDEGYILTASSRLLVKDSIASLSPLVLCMLDPAMVSPWHFLGEFFRGDKLTAFEAAFGLGFWEYRIQDPEFTRSTVAALDGDSRIMGLAIQDQKAIFQGVNSLVDVAGGTGIVAKAISEAFPHLKCTVLDLPQVVANLPNTKNLDYVGGDMFQKIPCADAIFLKSTLHNWGDEDCIKILQLCREAIPSKDEGGKVIIIDMVINEREDEHELCKTKLFSDVMMMALVAARERNVKDWEKLFFEAGFSHYKITPTSGIMSFIEVYP